MLPEGDVHISDRRDRGTINTCVCMDSMSGTVQKTPLTTAALALLDDSIFPMGQCTGKGFTESEPCPACARVYSETRFF